MSIYNPGLQAPIARADLAQEDLAVYYLPWLSGWYMHGEYGPVYGYSFYSTLGKYGESTSYIRSSCYSMPWNFYLSWNFCLPPEYVAGQTIKFAIDAYVEGTGATKTIDLEVKAMANGAMGSDICCTAIQDTSTSWARYTFEITPTGQAPGDVLHISAKAYLSSGGAAIYFYGCNPHMLLDIKG